ncbi:COP23 domain-containing protein [Aetokthonos hydrillicola Thurmond2011]|jgi:hypothetical protein|uniref:COP23 domain-containing protein n=1 Tax=Aetokthonos hydrillicola Thurmond2011 TaxID=2712845 RepID=A0AAP5IBQ8_9CYAN|nr:COP23 domain-containing protein [Aetokthonos hydrillicola]MBO3457155.1 hypothetical protein [Aetokthonos hydrillicola CCALA 1050]MBW4587505.1 COP23 domain-containing protein [Aetokthonos hydrillicola CCALA 1050]MDR9898630.1 COP23 domain-containing protein [Aetokthonos hydrillicola Thurmond2011]
MRLTLFTSILAASGIALSSMIIISQRSNAQTPTNSYFCGKSKDGVPTTFARTPAGDKIQIIRWEKKRIVGNYTPEDRCNIVSHNFQKASQDDVLNYITTGRSPNGYPVLCAAERYGEACSYILLTIVEKNDDTAKRVIENLAALGAVANGPVVQSFHSSGQPFIDMSKLLQVAPKEKSN